MESIVVAVIAVLLIGGLAGAVAKDRRRRLYASFGAEYALVVVEYGDLRAARRELLRRSRLYRALRLETISIEDQDYDAASWERVQDGFPHNPVRALNCAAELVRDLLDARGHPDAPEGKQVALLSVGHADALAGYRRAQLALLGARAESSPIPTEEMRSALIFFRVLFDDVPGARGAAVRQLAHSRVAPTTQAVPSAQTVPNAQVGS